MSFKIKYFVVFHDNIPLKTLEDLNTKDVEEKIVLYGVSPIMDIQHINMKNNLKLNTILEMRLPYYDPFLQYNCFDEHSAYYHLAHPKNKIHIEGLDFIGIGQYDMIVDRHFFSNIENDLKSTGDPNKTFLYLVKTDKDAKIHLDQGLGERGWQHLINKFNERYNTNFNYLDVIRNEFYIFNTFIMPKDIYLDLADFSQEMSKIIFLMCDLSVRHLSVFIERLHGVYFTLMLLDGKRLKYAKQLRGLAHSDDYKNLDSNDPTKVVLKGIKSAELVDSRRKAKLWDQLGEL